MIHPLSIVQTPLPDDAQVWQFTTVREGVKVGARCVIGSNCYVGVGTILGDDVHIQDKCHLTDHMTVGNRVFFAAGVITMNDKHPQVNNPAYKVESPVIEDDVAIGCAASILPGVRLGYGCVVGAGAVVTRDVAPGTTVVGNPARPLVAKDTVKSKLDAILQHAKDSEVYLLSKWANEGGS